jgi:HD superfamily phosphodiesterase
MDWSKFIHELFQIAEPYLVVRGDMLHAQVSHDYALRLQKQHGGSERIIEPAIILHDVGWSRLKPRQIAAAYGQNADGKEAIRLNRIHELEGAAIARQILVSLEFDPFLIEKISAIIERHDSGNNAPSPEEKVIKDADKLWRYSKIGFWNEVERQRLHPKEFYDFLASRYSSWLFTRTAIGLAEKELGRRINEID